MFLVVFVCHILDGLHVKLKLVLSWLFLTDACYQWCLHHSSLVAVLIFVSPIANFQLIISYYYIAGATHIAYKSSNSSALSSLTVPTNSEKSTSGSLLTPRSEGEILSSPHLKAFTLNELKNATRNFRQDNLIGEGGFGYVYKGWIDELTLSASRAGSGMVVAIKKLKPEGFQGHKEWLVGFLNFLLK